MRLIEPETRSGDEERHYYATSEIVNVGTPILMESLTRIGMLVEMRSIEAREAMRIVREMRRHPVEQDADAGGVGALDKVGEFLRRAEPAGRCIKRDRLVAPRAVERTFGDRQKLVMSEAE